MDFEKLRSIRPLTSLMIKLLQDCHHREVNNMEPPAFLDQEPVQGLVERGLLKASRDKREFRLTDLGKEYIRHYFGN